MPILKLEAGQRVTFAVRSTEIVEGKFGQQVKFCGETADGEAILFLNIEPARRQLSRISMDERTVQGQTVEFERVSRDGTLYTNINRVANGTAPRASAPAKQAYSSGPALPYETEQETGAPPAVAGFDKLFAAYSLIEDHVLATSVQKFERAKIGVSPESVAAQIATLLIQADRQGLTR